MRIVICCASLMFFLVFHTGIARGSDSDHAFEMGKSLKPPSRLLFVDPERVSNERVDFLKQLRVTRRNRRPLYERYIDVIGTNGILDGIERRWPKCHSQAHDLGKIIFARVRDIGTGLRICADRCGSGCMHGVLMEAFTKALDPSDPHDHPDLQSVKSLMKGICYDNKDMMASYSPGDCAHGVGHALMFLANYDISIALATCREYTEPAMVYYCATGAYMEYVTERDQRDAIRYGRFHPCDNSPYPAACFRYKMVYVVHRHYRSRQPLSSLIHACDKLSGKFRLGCFHGLGNAHMHSIAHGRKSIQSVCLHGTMADQVMCIEGVMERMAKYYEARAEHICADLEKQHKAICLTAARHKMYNMQKDLSLYLSD